MKKTLGLIIILFAVCLLCGRLPLGIAEGQPAFLLGDNEKLDIVPTEGRVTSLELGRNPVSVLTGSKGQKIVICAGDQKRSGEVEQGASLRLLDQSLSGYEKVIQWDAQLTAYTVNKEATTAWFAVRDGMAEKNKVDAKVYRVDLETFAIQELVVDSIPTNIELSGDGKWLAIATLGDKDSSTSALAIVDAGNMKQVSSFGITKNPGVLCFSDDSRFLVAASYGYRKGLEIQSPFFAELKQPIPAKALVIDLSTMQGSSVELGEVNKEFLLGQNATVYGVTAKETGGSVSAAGPGGLAWNKAYDFTPSYIQETPDAERLLITGANRVSILEKATGQSVKEFTAEKEFGPWMFIQGSSSAYAYNPSVRQLNILNLNNCELEKPLTAGSAGLAALKVIAGILSFAQYGMEPQYVNGVRMPYSRIYWVHPARGNVIACPELKKLFILNTFLGQYYTYDMEKGTVNPKKGSAGEKALYLQMAPNGKYIIVVGGEVWKLINTGTEQADLVFFPNKVKVRFVFQQPTASKLYFSPDGNQMYIPAGGKVTVIDLQTGKEMKDIKTKAKDAIVCW